MKHQIAIVDSNAVHAKMVADALLTYYGVRLYGMAGNAISSMCLAVPNVIIVGPWVGGLSGINFFKDLRKEQNLESVPVIFVIDNDDYRSIDTMRELGLTDYLVKPYRRSELLNAISRQLNGRVEPSWHHFPAAQRAAVEGTLNAFNGIADDIANGDQLSHQAINDSCAALVEAITEEGLDFLLNKVKDHDNFTFVHSLRFATLMALFGKAVGLPKDQQTVVAIGGLLHDIGMMGVPRGLLDKQEKLTSDEWKIMRGHVGVSQKIILNTDFMPKGVLTIATQDHERLDGSGYPRGLRSSDLNELARMAAIIDVFCGLTEHRAYKPTISNAAALSMMASEMREQLDPIMLSKFQEILLDTVVLRDGAL